MKAARLYFSAHPLNIMLLAFPLAILAELANWGAIVVFLLSALAVIPLAGLLGEATEGLAALTGPKIGGLLNATLGNSAELIITLVAIRAGLLELVKASITGSILGNLLFVMGMSMVVGGVKNGLQRFDRKEVGNHAVLLVLAVLALAIPSIFSNSIGGEGSFRLEELSLGVAFIVIILYILGLIYSLKNRSNPIAYQTEKKIIQPKPSIIKALVILTLATIGVVVMSELLVGAVEVVVKNLGLSEFFLGIILIPIIGNVAEHLVAVRVAMRNQMDLSVEIALSSSLQIALFVAPLLVFVSLFMGNPLTLIFHPFELVALGGGVIIASLVSSDGESNWLEGAALLAVYLIFGFTFFLLPV